MIPKEMQKAQQNGGVSSAPAAGQRSPLRMFAAAGIVAAGLALVVGIYTAGLTPAEVTGRDYIQYWAAGQQLAHHRNPYDVRAIYALERQNGMEDNDAKMSVSPPVALETELPLGWVSAKTGLIGWLLAELISVLVSIRLIWGLCGKPDSLLPLVSLAFAPVVACQMAGQLGVFFLLSVALFLALVPPPARAGGGRTRARAFLAGVALMPLALKPHLFVPYAIALLIWCVARGRTAVLAGALSALAASFALSLEIDPHAWAQYSELSSAVSMMDWRVPTLAIALRYWIHPTARWIGFVPEAAACAWAAWYAWKRRIQWDWMEHGQLVMLISVLSSPYSWISDQCVILPSVLAVVLRNGRSSRPLFLFLLIDGVMLAQLFTDSTMTSFRYVWTAPAWLAWYLYATRGRQTQEPAGYVAGPA